MSKKVAAKELGPKMAEFFEVGLQGPSVPPKATPDSTFGWLVDRVEANRCSDWKPNTRCTNRMYFAVIKKKLGQFPIRDFSEVEMQDYLRGWLGELAGDGKSKSYIQHILIYVRAALDEAQKRRLLHFNYAKELRVPKLTKDVDEAVLSACEIAELVAHLRADGQHRDALILMLFYLCALRPGELFGLRWDDWDERHPD